MDGASEVRILWRIVFPQVRPTLLAVLITVMILVLKDFDLIYVTANGLYDSDVIANLFFRKLFTDQQAGQASAIVVVLLILVIPILIYQVKKSLGPGGEPMSMTMKDGRRRSIFATIAMPLLAILWTIPTIGLLVTSFRSREAAASTGWWTSLWEGGWTLDNYAQVLGDPSISGSLINSVVVAVPATVLPDHLRGLRCIRVHVIKFPAKDALFIVIVALMVVPIQVASSRCWTCWARGAWGSMASSWRFCDAARRLRHAAGGVHTAQLHGHPSELSRGKREDRWGLALPDVLAPGRTDVLTGDRGLRHPAVPVGVERPAHRQAVPGRQAGQDGHREPPADAGNPGSGHRAPDRRCLRRW